jgi:hypothetical protein
MPVSGSSEDELNPIYQPVDDVIEMAIGVPEILEFYIVAKI